MTRLGVLSDIHGNLTALEAVLTALERQHVDGIVCLGDLVGYGPWPQQVIGRMQQLQARSVRGNHDAATASPVVGDYLNPTAAAAIEWTKGRLTSEEVSILSTLPVTRVEHGVTLVHGSLRGPLWEYLHDPFVAQESFDLLESRLALYGHTHLPGGFATDGESVEALQPAARVSLDPERRYLLNPGSVGQPRDGDPRAAFAVLDLDRRQIAFHRVAYDIEATAREILGVGLPPRLAARLFEGR